VSEPTAADAQEHPGEAAERRTTYLELFFDLVFVFAITQVTTLVLDDMSAGGFARSALVLALIWWAWSAFAWMTNAIDLGSAFARAGVLAAAAGSLFMAIALPDAYQDAGVWFAAPYFSIRVLNLVLYVRELRDDREHQAAVITLAPFFFVSPALVLAGGFLDDPWRVSFWAVAMSIDVLGALNAGRSVFRVSPSHFAERYGLFVIIALGESIVAIGVSASSVERDAKLAGAVAVSFAGVATLWWAYFDFVAPAVERALKRAGDTARAKFARDVFTFCHYPIVAGVILFAVAAKKTVAHPDEALSGAGRFALGAGLAVYLLGFILSRYRSIRRIAWERVGGGAAVALAAFLLADIAAAALMAVVVAILALALAVEAARLREVRASVRAGL